MNEIVNDSDSNTDNIPKFSSSEESESESANESDNENNISIPVPSRRQTEVIPTTGFSENDHQPRIPPFKGNLGVQFAVAVQNPCNFGHCCKISSELIIYQIGKLLSMKVCLVGGVVCITQAKLQSTAYCTDGL